MADDHSHDHDHEHDHSGPESTPVAPYLVVDGARDAIAFYERAFGATVINSQEAPDGSGKFIHVAMALNGGLVMFSDDMAGENSGGPPRSPKALGGTSVTIHLEVDNADDWWQRAIDAGATAAMPLENTFWGARYGIVQDPFGHRWSMASDVG